MDQILAQRRIDRGFQDLHGVHHGGLQCGVLDLRLARVVPVVVDRQLDLSPADPARGIVLIDPDLVARDDAEAEF